MIKSLIPALGSGGGGTGVHNELTGLQGGNATERYHLTQAQYDWLTAWLEEQMGDLSVIDGGFADTPSGDYTKTIDGGWADTPSGDYTKTYDGGPA